VKFSVWPSNGHSWQETLALAQWASANDFDGYWYADHLMPNRPDGTPDPGDALECWSVLAAIGALVPRVRLVSMVSPVTIHHPVLLAKRATTVDHISGGRAVLGLGAGWQVNEHAAYGFDLPSPGPRVDRFAEAIEIVHRLVREPSVTHDGHYYHLAEAPLGPKPVGSLPLLVGTGSPRMLRLTARFADEWNTWGDPDLVRERTADFEAACAAVDRDPATVHRSCQALVIIGEGAHGMPGRTIAGGPQALVDQLNRYVELGVDEFAIPDFTLGATPAERADAFALLHAEVLPHVG
jgi:alkanesulfonate monooxygenase SsuD/methylene tetrahydromethanopterin reductase-like flavin-dependent oxidoreductase (luciferase family)